jgi:hypothetical protein
MGEVRQALGSVPFQTREEKLMKQIAAVTLLITFGIVPPALAKSGGRL